MPNPFRIVVYAIAAVAILALFFTYLLPLFAHEKDALETLNTNLGVAEVDLGRGVTQIILFKEMAFSGQTLDSDNRSVAFECNDATLCCNIGEKDENCTRAIQWGERNVEIKEEREIETTVRCIYEHLLFVCRVYLGKKPAQVKIAKSEIKSKINLDAEKPELDLVIENAGMIQIFSGMIKAEVFEKSFENNQWTRRYVGTASIEQQFGEIKAEERLGNRIQINVRRAGLYEIGLKVWGENAGFDMNTLAFEATGGNKCMAQSCDIPTAEFNTCKTLCHCVNCMLGSNCEQDIMATIRQIDMGNNNYKNVDLSGKGATIIGTNLVRFTLPAEYCP